MNKIKVMVLVFLMFCIRSTYAAVTETDQFNFNAGITLGVQDPTVYTNLPLYLATTYYVTNTYNIENTLEFAITSVYNRVMLDDIRMYTTNNSAISKRAVLQLFRKPTRRCEDLVYLDTNQLYYAVQTTADSAANIGTNVVADASGIIKNDLYYQWTAGTTNSYCRATQTTATVIYWGSTNLFSMPSGSLLSHVNQFGSFPYYDMNGTSNLYFRLTFTTPWTCAVRTVINYGR